VFAEHGEDFNMNAEYFIKKFESIPDDHWCVNHFVNPENINQMCALGHCGERLDDPPPLPGANYFNDEAHQLKALFHSISYNIRDVNDGTFGCEGLGKTPKERVLKVLRLIKSTTN